MAHGAPRKVQVADVRDCSCRRRNEHNRCYCRDLAVVIEATCPDGADGDGSSVYQANIVVGFGSGAKLDPTDRTQIEFSEIANAGRFDPRQPFEFEKYILKVTRVYEVKDELTTGGPSAISPGSRRLVWVVAKVIGKRE